MACIYRAGVRDGRPGPTPMALVQRGAPQWYKTITIYMGRPQEKRIFVNSPRALMTFPPALYILYIYFMNESQHTICFLFLTHL